MRISDWSSGVCSSDLVRVQRADLGLAYFRLVENQAFGMREGIRVARPRGRLAWRGAHRFSCRAFGLGALARRRTAIGSDVRSEEHTSELQSLMRISYAVFCLQKKKKKTH